MRKQRSCQEKEIMQGTMPGACTWERPRMAWMDNIKMWTRLPMEESIRMTEKRDKWRKYVHGVANPQINDSSMAKNRTEQPYPLYFIVCKFLKRVTWPWPHPFRDDFLLTGWEWIWSTYIPNLKSFSALVMKLWMAVQNAEKGWYRVVRSWAMSVMIR